MKIKIDKNLISASELSAALLATPAGGLFE